MVSSGTEVEGEHVMPNTIEDEVIRKLQERATREELNGIEVTYRVTGGAPGEQLVDEELHLSGPGPMTARVRTPAAAMRESSENLAAPEMKDCCCRSPKRWAS